MFKRVLLAVGVSLFLVGAMGGCAKKKKTLGEKIGDKIDKAVEEGDKKVKEGKKALEE
jgi:hypothetical protein